MATRTQKVVRLKIEQSYRRFKVMDDVD
jgi:hypothetical protein